jgi:antiviral helicase SKI2
VDFFKGQDLTSSKDKSEVKRVMNKVLSRLNPSDARLPQVLRTEEMLLRGFGVHHGGLLPVLKESVELLYSKSVVKVLLATETFAMVSLACDRSPDWP